MQYCKNLVSNTKHMRFTFPSKNQNYFSTELSSPSNFAFFRTLPFLNITLNFKI